MVERRTENPCASGSIPLLATNGAENGFDTERKPKRTSVDEGSTPSSSSTTRNLPPRGVVWVMLKISLIRGCRLNVAIRRSRKVASDLKFVGNEGAEPLQLHHRSVV